MNVNHTVCDECQRVKGASNHWYKIGVTNFVPEGLSLSLGAMHYDVDEVHDLCGEQCFYKHIGKLLRLNPTEAE